ncbi:rhamnogalacturonan acetylesterase [Bremerella sp. T1]|uniref:rhamnogalacturonan acetylesterase n=1 Tax=Bremerella sp. TYQ1 TaxID=3119568 RepID=UPI001CC9C56C|nr:rhamnogalacturonan acetylesterase [Bremerella volcania]UBM35109.1 rhamnogalacturonan acetylesterase [Bremerella volcania]
MMRAPMFFRSASKLFYCVLPLLTFLLLSPNVHADKPSGPWKFDLGDGPAGDGYVPVGSKSIYSDEQQFGFDLNTSPRSIEREDNNDVRSDAMTSDEPFFFSAKLPEGNYRVTVTFGDAENATSTWVKAESRRLMLTEVATRPGEFEQRAFTVNIRTPALPDGDHVGLKTREQGVLHWDDKLTLEFSGKSPSINAIEIEAVPEATTIYLLGDSTVTDQPREPWNSWGQMLPRFFGPEVAVANHAESGESIKGSLRARRVKKVLTSLKPGDYVLVQFGHNDMKDKAPDALAKYKMNYEQLVEDVRSRGATPVLITSMERKAGVKQLTLQGYPDAVRDVAKAKDVALIDLQTTSVTLYKALGDQLGAAFQDGTHHNAYGSYLLANCVAEGIRDNVPELATHLRTDVPPFDPHKPMPPKAFRVPPSPSVDLTKPDGS